MYIKLGVVFIMIKGNAKDQDRDTWRNQDFSVESTDHPDRKAITRGEGQRTKLKCRRVDRTICARGVKLSRQFGGKARVGGIIKSLIDRNQAHIEYLQAQNAQLQRIIDSL